MKRLKVVGFMAIILFALSTAVILLIPAEVQAQSKVAAIEGVGFNVAGSMKDNLKPLVNKDVYVNLRSGKTYQGFVKSVGDHFIHLEKIAGKDYFDALVRIEDISAIEVKFREPR
jgi:small nuclear ribonucleoprotein (snRNP)-like protein